MSHVARSRLHLVLAALLAAAGLVALLPGRADAFNCSATAVRGTLLGRETVAPITVNPSVGQCGTAEQGINQALPNLLTANIASARTAASGSGPSETASASGGLGDIRVLPLGNLPIQLPAPDLSQVPPLTIPGVGTIDLKAAVAAALPNGRLPNADLLDVGTAVSSANARCVAGSPRLDGSSQVAGLRLLGQELPTDRVTQQTLTLINTAAVDPSTINPASVPLPAGVTLDPTLTAQIQAALDAIPTIPIPATVLNVKVTPAQQERTADRLTQRALRVEASIAGQPVADVTVGEAIVANGSTTCAVAEAAPQAELECTTRRIVLTDVVRRGNRVRLKGTADKARFAGLTVNIVATYNGRTVARPRVRSDGSFSATAPLPPKKIRRTDRARYLARIGTDQSLRLKLFRRMLIDRTRVRSGRLTIVGRIVRPLASPLASVTVKRRISCRSGYRRVKTFKPRRDGTFTVTLPAPPTKQRAVYRLETRVRKNTRNPKLFQTFTLPRFVDLGR